MGRTQALVFGGTGAVGGEVVRGLARAGLPTIFTYHRNVERAEALSRELAVRSEQLDLADPSAIRAFLRRLAEEGQTPDVVIHCAAVSRAAALSELTDADWEQAVAVNCRSTFVALKELAPGLAKHGEAHVVLLGGLDRGQSLPLPVQYAATQGMQAALTMALARELGRSGVRVNLVALGLLEGGLSSEISPRLLGDYRSFSALRRVGSLSEGAQAALWLALENSYMSGKVLAVNGGI